MQSSYDLHTHSTVSDGAYAPGDLIRAAHGAGITHLALSDHDCLDGLADAQVAADACGITLIPGVEISVSWQSKSIHVVGLNIAADCQELREGLAHLQNVRMNRAEQMGARLAKHGIEGAFEAALKLANGGMITRTHFARYLVSLGLVATVKDVFSRYLTHGKPGYIGTEWAPLEDAVRWIRMAGGVAVIAHPQRYKLTGDWMRRLFTDFKLSGGAAIEVVSGAATNQEIQSTAQYCRRFDLAGSVGSDFHSAEYNWLQLGRLPPLPVDVRPVWQSWNG